MTRFLQQSWFLIVLVSALVLGYLLAERCRPLAEMALLKWCVVAFTMFVMALPVSFSNLKEAAGRFTAPVLAIGLNMIAVPLLAWPLSWLLTDEMGYGLIVAAAAPCTLASAAVWTRRAGGNDAVAILVSLVTNSLCFIIMPFWIYVLIGRSASNLEHVDFGETVWKLALLVVLPMGIGQLLRIFRPVASWSTHNRRLLGVVAQIGILFIVLIGSVATTIRLMEAADGGGTADLVLALILVAAIHVMVLGLGLLIARALGCNRGERIAVGFSGSQKTLMVGLSTAMEMGVSIVPIIAYHSVQLLVDTVIADKMKTREGAEE